MSRLNIHYSALTGRIIAWDSAHRPDNETRSHLDGLCIVKVDGYPTIDFARHKIDLKTLKLIEMSDAEKANARLPSDIEVRCAIEAELSRTDSFAVPDRPLTDNERGAWKVYRQVLRELSQMAPPAQMVKAWPIRPDGADAISDLRARVPKESK